jgi:hypothetical protein
MLYLAVYLAIGIVFGTVMSLINERHKRPAGEQGSNHLPVSVYVLVGLAWPVSAAAFIYGFVAHLLDRAAAGGEPTA